MDIQKLINYKNKNSHSTIKNRAKSIVLSEVTSTELIYEFSYKGTQAKPYKIIVNQTRGTKTSCTCPYDFGGLCKHEIAALNFVIVDILKSDANKKLAKTVIAIKEELVLEDHLIQDTFLEDLEKNASSFYYKFHVIVSSITENKITTFYNDFHKAEQSFVYNNTTNVLKTSCSCKVRKKYCDHIYIALEAIVDQYGHDIFHPEYLNIIKKNFLKDYDLTLEDDYHKYFDFKLDKNGVNVIEKIKNIVPSLDKAKENLIPQLVQENKDGLHVLTKKNHTKNFGIGFCFELTKHFEKTFFNLLPFKAKYKKRSKEFASLYKEIDEYNFIKDISDFNTEDKFKIINALGFENDNNYLINNFKIEHFREAFIKFQEFIKLTKEHLFFEKNSTNNISKKNLKQVFIKEETPRLFFTLTKKEELYTLKAKLQIGDKTMQIDNKSLKIYPYFCKIKENIYLFKDIQHYIFLDRFHNKAEINFLSKDYPNLYKEILKPLTEYFELKTKIYKTIKPEIETLSIKKQVYLSDFEGEYILFKLAIQYGEQTVLLHSKEQLFNETIQQITPRDIVFENDFLEDFTQLHADFKEQDNPFYLTPFQLIENEWLLKTSEIFKHKGIEVFGVDKLKSFKYNLNKPSISMNVSSNTDWFDLLIEIKFGKEIVSLKEVKKALLNKSNYILLSDGSYGVLPNKWLAKFANYFKTGEVKKDAIKISNYQFNIIDELFDELEETPKFLLELQQKKKSLQNLETATKVAVPKNIKATLRPYQEEGFNWLLFLDKNNLGGCLADDMGLGKTLQTITFISYLKSKKKNIKPHLVIAPTSVIFNWEKEIEKFCPSLKTLVYTGIKRKELLNSFNKQDVILTTYGSILNDIEFLKEISFGYIVLDESQAIKNPNSKRYKAIRLLNANNRLALTGTPIENNTFDLYAQMNFINPGLFGAISHFKKEFSDPIDKLQDQEASKLLSKIIHPFLLRRTKEQVATELPEKTETILYCEMKTEQRQVYESVKNKFRDYLLNKIEENGVAKSQMYVLEGLTKLRQICNSPELLKGDQDYGKESIKLDILIDNIKSKTANHKILVFSQFTSMLKLIKDRLEDHRISYEYLDGSTRNREERVDNFQTDESIRVFLISLKAGGVGLNLTAADYVFVVDPWWNPAVESQAIDRCYRIGQTKKVMAYKMICKDTIEEKIINLQEKKKEVSSSVIQIDKIKKSFNNKQIKELFS